MGLLDGIASQDDDGGLLGTADQYMAAPGAGQDGTQDLAAQSRISGEGGDGVAGAIDPQSVWDQPGIQGVPAPPLSGAPAQPGPSPSAKPQGGYRTIAVGDYQMPLVGSAADAAPAASANAQAPQGAGQGQGNQGQGNQGQGGNAWSNFFNRGADALGSISRGGSVLGAVRGQYDDPQSQQAQAQNLTQQALLNRGVPQDIAAAAVQPGNGGLLNAAITQAFGGAQRQSAGGMTGQRSGTPAPPAQQRNTVQPLQKTIGGKTYYQGSDGHWYPKS